MGKRKLNFVYDYLKQEEVLNKPWLTTSDLMIILPLGENAINNFRKTICDEMDLKNEEQVRALIQSVGAIVGRQVDKAVEDKLTQMIINGEVPTDMNELLRMMM